MSVKYSIVIPIKDEEQNIPALLSEVEVAMKSLGEPWELICIDDGSKDKSLKMLIEAKTSHPQLKTLAFKKNFGQSSAFDAGFKAASGDYIITLDGDLQNDPADIPLLLSEIKDNDMICGWRHLRKDTLFKRVISKFSNVARSRLCKDQIHDSGCSLKVFKKSSLDQIRLYHGMHRFFPALFKLEGFSVIEVKVNHRPRTSGKSKYHFFNRSIGPFIDMFVVYWMRKRKLQYEINKEH